MSDGKPLDWQDLPEDWQESAVRNLMRLRRVNREQAQDAVVDAMARLVEGKVVSHSPLGLLVTAAHHVLTNTARREQRHRDLLKAGTEHELDRVRQFGHDEDGEPKDPAVLVAEKDEQSYQARFLRRALGDLSDVDRRSLVKHYFEEEDPREIDNKEGLGRGCTARRVARARRHLRSAFITHTVNRAPTR